MSLRALRWACGLVIVAAALAAAATGTASQKPRHLDLAVARETARAAVVADPTYRIIDSAEPLRTRRCWRASGGAVRCSLFRVAGSPCALDGGPPPGGLCVQVLARRIWLVHVNLAGTAGKPAARMLRVVDEPVG